MSTPPAPAVAAGAPAAPSSFSFQAIAYGPTTRKVVRFMATFGWVIAGVGVGACYGVAAGVAAGAAVALVARVVRHCIKPVLAPEVERIFSSGKEQWEKTRDLSDWVIKNPENISFEELQAVIVEMDDRGFSDLEKDEVFTWWWKQAPRRDLEHLGTKASLIFARKGYEEKERADTAKFGTACNKDKDRTKIQGMLADRNMDVPTYIIADWFLYGVEVATKAIGESPEFRRIPARALIQGYKTTSLSEECLKLCARRVEFLSEVQIVDNLSAGAPQNAEKMITVLIDLVSKEKGLSWAMGRALLQAAECGRRDLVAEMLKKAGPTFKEVLFGYIDEALKKAREYSMLAEYADIITQLQAFKNAK